MRFLHLVPFNRLPIFFALIFSWPPLIASAQELPDAGDIEILNAFQERHYADRGQHVYWGLGLDSANHTWPAEGNYPQTGGPGVPNVDDFIEDFIYTFLQRHTGTNSERPLFYLNDDNVEGSQTWADIQKKIIHLPAVPTGLSLSPLEKRLWIIKTLRRQRILVTDLRPQGRTVKSYSSSGAPLPRPANLAESADKYDEIDWAPANDPADNPPDVITWNFHVFNSGNYTTVFDASAFKLGLSSHLTGVPFKAFLRYTVPNFSFTDSNNAAPVTEHLAALGLAPAAAGRYREFGGRYMDLGNILRLCTNHCEVTVSLNFAELENIITTNQHTSFALAYPVFNYLADGSAPGGGESSECCEGCEAGSERVRLGSVDVRIMLGRGSSGKSRASLAVNSPHVTGELWTPRSLRASLAPGFVQVTGSQGELIQAYGPATIAQVTALTTGVGYEVKLYDRPANLEPLVPGGVLDVTSLTETATYRFKKPAGAGAAGAGQRKLLFEKEQAGSPLKAWTYTTTENAGPFVTELTFPEAYRSEKVVSVASTAANGNPVETETRTTNDATGAVIGREVRVFRTGTKGRLLENVAVLAKFIPGGGGAPPTEEVLTTAYTYETDDPERLDQVVRPDGSWDQYDYDALNRVIKHRSGLRDSAPSALDSQCLVETTTWPNGGTTKTTVTTSGGPEVGRRYFQELADGYKEDVCTVAGASIGASTNLVVTAKWHLTGWFARQPHIVTAPDGTITKYTYATFPEGVHPFDADTVTTMVESGVPNTAGTAVSDGTRTTRITNREGHVILETSQDIVSGSMLSSRLAASIDAQGRPVTWSYLDGSEEFLNYDCCGLFSRTDREGVTRSYTRDRTESRVPAGGGVAVIGLESSTVQTGNLEFIQREEGLTSRTFRKGADDTLIETARTVRDPAGRVVSSRDAVGSVTVFSEQFVAQAGGAKHLLRTTNLPGGGTRVEEYFQDGSLKRVTGTAVHGQRYEYGVDGDGSWTQVTLLLANGNDSGEWSRSWTDIAGRSRKTLTSSGALTTRHFNSKGQLWKTVDADGVTALTVYDDRGRPVRSVLDVNRNSIVDLDGPDRITETVQSLALRDDEPVWRTITSVWPENDDTPVELSRTEVHVNGTESWTISAGLTTYVQKPIAQNSERIDIALLPDETSTLRYYAAGRLAYAATNNAFGEMLTATVYQYDAHNRIRSTTDSTGATTLYTYFDDDRVQTVTTADPDGEEPQEPQVTTYTYTALGQPDVVTLPDGRTTNSDYYSTGELFQTTGTAAPPVAYTYDHAGRVKTLTSAGAVTTWNYDPNSGLLQSKVHPANSGGVSYTWTPGGRAKTKINGRVITTSYRYDHSAAAPGVISGAGDLVKVDYQPHFTASVIYQYDRLGRVSSATTGIGDAASTRSVDLTVHGQLESESWTGGPLDGLTVDPAYDVLRRRSSLGGDVPGHSYDYDAFTGELASISTAGPGPSGTATAKYSYRAGTRQVEGLEFRGWFDVLMLAQQRSYDALHRLTGVTSQGYPWSGPAQSLSESYYTLDDSNRRTQTRLGDGTWWKYTYDTHGQVTGAERRLMAGASPAESDATIPGQQFGYGYNAGGNRTTATQGGGGVDEDVAAGYTPTAANQYASTSRNRTALTTGAAQANASVEVNEAAVARAGPWWGYSESVPGTNAATVDFATTANYNGHFDQILTRPLVPPATVTPLYDGDGNLIDDGLRTFIWDAQNRLAFVVTKDSALPPGAPHYRVGFQYDDLGRRIAQTVEARPTPDDDWVVARRRAFLYDGWQCVAEYDYARTSGGGATHILFRSQVWGLDIGGGAGGLLMVRRHTGPQARLHYAVSDGNGNVTALFDTLLLQESARYDYDPFGNLLRATGYAAAENPYRFSSQFTDDVTGLVYYGYRHYEPVHGRWLSRDPIGETGGVNLYGFLGNDGVNDTDLLGAVSNAEVRDAVSAVSIRVGRIELAYQAALRSAEMMSEYGESYRDLFCEAFEEYKRHNALLPGERDRMQAMLKELLGEQSGLGFGSYLFNKEAFSNPLGAYAAAMEALAAAQQAGMLTEDVWTQALIQHADISNLATLVGNNLTDYTADMAYVRAGSISLLAGAAVLAGGPAGLKALAVGSITDNAVYHTAKVLGASESTARTAAFVSGIAAGGYAAAGRTAANSGLMNPNSIRFSQNSIKAGFQNPAFGTIDDLAAGLRSGAVKPGSIAPIRLVERQGILISIDNRRLEAFRRAGVDVPTRMATPAEIQQAIQRGKFSAGKLGGTTIQVRGQ